MLDLAVWLKKNGFRADQVQAFLPSPMATATAMYHSGKNPLRRVSRSSEEVVIPKGIKVRRLHKAFLRYHDPENWPILREALKRMGRADLILSLIHILLGKVIAWGESRIDAIDTLSRALRELQVVGVITNRALLASVLADEEFRGSTVATDYLGARQAHLAFGEPKPTAEDFALAALWYATRATAADALWQDTRGWRLGAPPRSSWCLGARRVTVEMTGADSYVARSEGREIALRLLQRTAHSLDVEIAGGRLHADLLALGLSLIHIFNGDCDSAST